MLIRHNNYYYAAVVKHFFYIPPVLVVWWRTTSQTGAFATNAYMKWGLKINYGKTEYLGTDHTEDLQVNGNIIPTVK
jgi:hypothetical protein